MPRYYNPYRGYGYTRFSISFSLNSLFYGSRYWINNPGYYRLPPAYGGTRWIRYSADALMFAPSTGSSERRRLGNDCFNPGRARGAPLRSMHIQHSVKTHNNQ